MRVGLGEAPSRAAVADLSLHLHGLGHDSAHVPVSDTGPGASGDRSFLEAGLSPWRYAFLMAGAQT